MSVKTKTVLFIVAVGIGVSIALYLMRQLIVPVSLQNAKLNQKMVTVVAELDRYMQKLVASDMFSGTILIARNGKPFYMRAFGQAHKDFNVANTIDTKFNVGSLNKMFTAVAIAQLVERGDLSFEDPLGKFLPDYPNAQDSKKIKIRHLLTHTSGLGSFFNKKFHESSRDLFHTVDDMLKLADDTSIAFEPGTGWQYSNTGFLLLGAIIEKISGQGYFDYVREHIYKPAGMMSTDCYELDKVNQNLAVGYIPEFSNKGVSFKNNIFIHVVRGGPAGGGYSTVEDLLKFDRALRENKLIEPQMKEQLFTAKPELNALEYGYGFAIDASTHSFGHQGGFAGISSTLKMYQNVDYTVVILSNYSNGSILPRDKITDMIQGMLVDDKADGLKIG